MNASLEPYRPSRAIDRISTNLQRYLIPGIQWSNEPNLIILPVIGRRDHTLIRAAEIKAQGKQYAVIQLALKSTRNPDPEDWRELWEGAKVVWSYYDLPLSDYYHAPLGADPDIFRPLRLRHNFIIGMTGEYERGECLWECERAARVSGRAVKHILNVTDRDLPYLYNCCDYISGLRHKEGFELPAAEALLCGVRPVLFDTPNFRRWYDGLAEYIPEQGVIDVAASLIRLFAQPYRRVETYEIDEARRRFDWQRIITGFWERCLD